MYEVLSRPGFAAICSGLLIGFVFSTALVTNTPASAAEWVSFHTATTPHSAFKIRQAKSKGIVLKPKIGTKIGGTLYLPESAEPSAAVVFVHGCRGLRKFNRDWAEKVTQWGYAALLVDSFGPRKVDASQVCANLLNWDFHEEIGGRPFDVVGALDFLSKHPKIDGNRLSVISWEAGAALSMVAKKGIRELFDYKIKGGDRHVTRLSPGNRWNSNCANVNPYGCTKRLVAA